jgi:hypothetical protein
MKDKVEAIDEVHHLQVHIKYTHLTFIRMVNYYHKVIPNTHTDEERGENRKINYRHILGAETKLSVLLRPEIYAYHRPSSSLFDFSSDKKPSIFISNQNVTVRSVFVGIQLRHTLQKNLRSQKCRFSFTFFSTRQQKCH